jgi:2-keto-4-pentenoate hydratase
MNIAQALLLARGTRSTLDAADWQEAIPDADTAYRVQEAVFAEWGGAPRYWKSGAASRSAAFTHAALPAQGVLPSPADGRPLGLHRLLVEAEIAVRLGRAVTPQEAQACTEEEAAGWLDGMAVSIELVDTRFNQGVDIPAMLKLADGQAHGALVVGEFVPFVARDWKAQLCEVQIGAAAATQWRGTHALGTPTWLLPIWLRHVTRNGQTVPAGTVITTGTWCGLLPAQPGDRVVVRFDGVGEAAVQV